MTVFSGKAGVDTFTAIVIKSAIEFYAKTGMKMNSAYTPTAMLAKAGQITGKKFKRGQYQQAIDALGEWLAENGTTGEVLHDCRICPPTWGGEPHTTLEHKAAILRAFGDIR